METDSFFCQLLKHLPEVLFQLIGLPSDRARSYRFDSVELKKSFRIDGLFIPKRPQLPMYIVEIQFRRTRGFYANLFAKVFCYLEENNPEQEWVAVAIFPNRNAEPKHLEPYLDLLESKRVKRIYLDKLPATDDPPLGLGILQLVSTPEEQTKTLVAKLLKKARQEFADSDFGPKVIELIEELLIRRFNRLSREEIRTMFQLHDLRKTRVWQEAREEGLEEGLEKGLEKGRDEGRDEGKTLTLKEVAQNCLEKGLTHKEIAELLKVSLEEARRLTRKR